MTLWRMRYVLTERAKEQATRRGIALTTVDEVIRNAEQRFPQRPGRDILQSRVAEGARTWLVRVVVDVGRDPAEVVTVYRTSNVERYWRESS